MALATLKDYIEPYPGIRDFIFTPPTEGSSRTWIYCSDEATQTILDFRFSSLITHGWRILQNEPSILAKRGDTNLSVNALTRNDGTRIVYELRKIPTDLIDARFGNA